MNSDNKPPRGRKPGTTARSGDRPGKPSFGKGKSGFAKGAAKPGFGKGAAKPAFGKGSRAHGKPFAKPDANRDGERKPFVKREYGDRPPRETTANAERKPFVKREYGDRPPREATASAERKPFVKREYGDRPPPRDGERKPFVKREPGERSPREVAARPDAGGHPQKYWGKRPGKRERASETTPAEGARPARQDRPDGARPVWRDRTNSKPAGKSFGGERPARSERTDGVRPAWQDRAGGGKPFGARTFGDRPTKRFEAPRSNAGGPTRGFDEKRPGSGRPRERRPEGGVDSSADQSERIAKRLARAGISSRRDAEALVAAGRVKVNGKVLDTPAFTVTVSDRIEVDNVEIPAIERTRLFLFHKPAGVVTTNRDPEGRRTVFDALPSGLPRLMTVGRLDINTEGLLLLTNDGGLARVLELPATGWLRRYRVRVHGRVDEAALAGLKQGIAVDGVFYGSVEASLDKAQGSNAWLTIGMREGKNREVKNILGALGLEVARLIRVSYGPFQLGELGDGEVLEIKGRMLRDQLGETLIEESGANFDAEIAKPFSNKPVRRGFDKPDRPDDGPRRQPRQIGTESEGGLIKNFRRDRDDRRDNALGRLSTTRPERSGFGGPDGFKRGDGEGRGGRFARPAKSAEGAKPSFAKKPGGKREREERPIVEPGVRKANVWMAPGARPQGKKPSERAADKRRSAEGSSRPERSSQKPSGQFRGSSGDRPRGERPPGNRLRGPRPGGRKR